MTLGSMLMSTSKKELDQEHTFGEREKSTTVESVFRVTRESEFIDSTGDRHKYVGNRSDW